MTIKGNDRNQQIKNAAERALVTVKLQILQITTNTNRQNKWFLKVYVIHQSGCFS